MPKKQINLLSHDKFENEPLGKVLVWALSVGRWIVIITELVVLIAFLSRFKLDRDLSNLYESIREKQAIVSSFSSFEKDFRWFQNQLLTLDKLEKSQLQAPSLLTSILNSVPQDVALKSLSITEEEITISGEALSENGLGSFLSGIAASPLLGEINLSNVSRGSGSGENVEFSLTAKVNNQKT